MNEKNKINYKEYNGLGRDRTDFGKKIEGAVIPLIGSLLDYTEIMLDTLGISPEDSEKAFKAIRKKILRDGNNSVRLLLEELHKYSMKKLGKDIIHYNK